MRLVPTRPRRLRNSQADRPEAEVAKMRHAKDACATAHEYGREFSPRISWPFCSTSNTPETVSPDLAGELGWYSSGLRGALDTLSGRRSLVVCGLGTWEFGACGGRGACGAIS